MLRKYYRAAATFSDICTLMTAAQKSSAGSSRGRVSALFGFFVSFVTLGYYVNFLCRLCRAEVAPAGQSCAG